MGRNDCRPKSDVGKRRFADEARSKQTKITKSSRYLLFRCHCSLFRSQSCVPFGLHHGSRAMAEAEAAEVRTNLGLPSVYTASEI